METPDRGVIDVNAILQDLSPASLTAAIENNLFSLIHVIGQWPRAEVHEETTLKWSITDISFPLFNSVMGARLGEDNVDTTIQALLAQAKLRGVPLLWWTGPQTSPGDLAKHLGRCGFVGEDNIPGMAVVLAKLKDNIPAPAGFHLQQVKEDATWRLWCKVFGLVFGLPDFIIDAFYDFFSHADHEIMPAYLGWLEDKPVATSLLLLAGGVAGIYNVATLPEARRKGIGALMTQTPLLEARAYGYTAGTLQSSEMGAGVYRALGFQEYCKIGQYVWSPEQKHSGG